MKRNLIVASLLFSVPLYPVNLSQSFSTLERPAEAIPVSNNCRFALLGMGVSLMAMCFGGLVIAEAVGTTWLLAGGVGMEGISDLSEIRNCYATVAEGEMAADAAMSEGRGVYSSSATVRSFENLSRLPVTDESGMPFGSSVSGDVVSGSIRLNEPVEIPRVELNVPKEPPAEGTGTYDGFREGFDPSTVGDGLDPIGEIPTEAPDIVPPEVEKEGWIPFDKYHELSIRAAIVDHGGWTQNFMDGDKNETAGERKHENDLYQADLTKALKNSALVRKRLVLVGELSDLYSKLCYNDVIEIERFIDSRKLTDGFVREETKWGEYRYFYFLDTPEEVVMYEIDGKTFGDLHREEDTIRFCDWL